MCLVIEVNHVVRHPVRIHDACELPVAVEFRLLGRRQDQRRAAHGLSQLVLSFALVELLAHLAARMAPHARLHLGGVLACLRYSPSSPTKADAACPLNALLAQVRIDGLQDGATMRPAEFLQPLLALRDLLGFVEGLDGAAFEEVWHDHVVPTSSEGIAECLVITSIGAKNIVHHNNACFPIRITNCVHALRSPAEVELLALGNVRRPVEGCWHTSLWTNTSTRRSA
mmetsp:Transcript_94307/g.237768  ORF Transcript_94307/g.237768 Transcript_94307/m.237768 type:complete len:227 (+) Transcript_94307:360-1040(+)